EYKYNRGDRVIEHSDAEGHVTRFRYDSALRQTSTVLPDGSSDRIVYDRSGRIVAYDDRRGIRKLFEYDPLGRRTAVRIDITAMQPGTEVDGERLYQVSYDGLGRAV